MKSLKTMLAILCVFVLTGCQAMMYGTIDNFEINKIKPGMTKSEVIAIIGTPDSVGIDSEKGEEILVYKRMRQAISFWLHTYAVVLRNGKVIRYGEQIQVSQHRGDAIA